MRAVVIREHGGPEQVNVEDWPRPQIGPDEVLVQVKACGLNHLDIFVRRGMPGFPVQFPHIPGGDAAGVLAEVGGAVTGLQVGQRVVIHSMPVHGEKFVMLGEHVPGVMAEFVAVPARDVVPLPDAVSFEMAGGLPVAYATAWRMLMTRARIAPGETVLVLGASGGVGTACVQIARGRGCRVLAAASSDDKLRRLQELGADDVINYARNPDFHRTARQLTGGQGPDVVVDYIGKDTWLKSLKAVRYGGRVVTCGATTGFDPQTDIRFIWTREIDIRGANGWLRSDLEACVAAVAEGWLRIAIDRVLPLDQIQAAHRLMESRQLLGKIILVP